MGVSSPEPSPNQRSRSRTRLRFHRRLLRRLNWLRSPLLPWLGIGGALLIAIGFGSWAWMRLLGLTELPDCLATLEINSTSSERLYCADTLASHQTITDLQTAMDQISLLPSDDPLQAERDRRIAQWSQDLLRLAEAEFQTGNLDTALNAVNAISEQSPVYSQVRDRAKQWKATWEKAQTTYDEAIAAIGRQQWGEALSMARTLLALGNDYWATTQYQSIMDELQAKKESQSQANRAASEAKSAPNRKSQDEQQLAARLANAEQLAGSGTMSGLQSAIAEAKEIQLRFGYAGYELAQQKIDRWQQQHDSLQDRWHLDRAIQLARRGDEASLQAGIDEAYKVSPVGKLYDEARQQINHWSDQMYRLQYQEHVPSQPVRDRPSPTTTNPVQPSPHPSSDSDDKLPQR